MTKEKTGLSVFRTDAGKEEVRRRYEEVLAKWPVPNTRRFIGDTHIIECGDTNAEPLFLLHGTLSNSAAWMGDVKEWSSRFRVIAADIPGEPGLSSEMRISPAGDAFERWFESLLDELGYKGRAVSIVGQSLGSFVALRFAVRNPDRVKKISLLTTPAVAPAKYSFLFKAMFLQLFGKKGSDKINKMVAYGVKMDQWSAAFGNLLSKHTMPMTEPIPVLTDEQMGRLTMPLQLFAGDHDVLLRTPETVDRLRRLTPQTEINLLSGVGHVVIGKTSEIMEFMTR